MEDSDRIAMLERALGYYADDRVWETHPDMRHTSTAPAVLDRGQRARDALAQK